MASEDFVSYKIMRYLKGENWNILQYHPPGGQAGLAIKVWGKIVFPDLLAYKSNLIIVMENKPRFNKEDIKKLERMMSDKDALNQIRDFVSEYCKKNDLETQRSISIIWGHGFSGKWPNVSHKYINLVHVGIDGSITIGPPEEGMSIT